MIARVWTGCPGAPTGNAVAVIVISLLAPVTIKSPVPRSRREPGSITGLVQDGGRSYVKTTRANGSSNPACSLYPHETSRSRHSPGMTDS